MKVKVQCPCGSKFEFEVEPVEGRMPVTIQCPSCGADDTALANAVIAAQSAAPATPPAAQPVAAGPRQAPVSAAEELRRTEASYKLFKRVVLAAVFLLVATAVFCAWYKWFAREPKVAFSIALPKNEFGTAQAYAEPGEYHLIGPGQLLSISNGWVSLRDLKERKTVWSVQLPAGSQAQAEVPVFGKAGLLERHFAKATGNDVWLADRGRLFRLERANGAAHEVEIKGEARSISVGEDSAVLACGSAGRVETLTRVLFSTGEQKTEELAKPVTPAKVLATKPAAARPVRQPNLSQLAKTLNPTAGMSGNEGESMGTDAAAAVALNLPAQDELLEAGENVVEFHPRLLELKFVDRAAMKQKKNAGSILDSVNLTASQGTEVAEEMMNDNQRAATGGVEHINVSAYEVALRRHFAGEIPEWRGKVTGVPRLIPLKSVDVLSAGTNIYVFDKRNTLLWEAKSPYPLVMGDDEENPPLLETEDSLYAADLGNLTRFDLKTGNVRWRYNAVGISQIVFDATLGLYVISTTASSESITYSQEINLRKKIHTVMQRLDAATGTALWRQEAAGDRVLISGKHLYATRVNLVTVQLELENGPQPHFYTALIEPGTGLPVWTYHRADERHANVEVSGRWVMQQFPDRLVVLNFFSF